MRHGEADMPTPPFRLAAFLILWMVLPTICRAGEYTADFLRIGVGARPLAMGGAYVALAHDATGTYWNPAGLAPQHRFVLHFDHVPLFNGLAQYNTASLNLAFNRSMSAGLCWIRLGVDEIPRYSALSGSRYDRLTLGKYRSTGEAEDFFADTEDAVLVSFNRRDYFDLYLGGGFAPIRIPMELALGVTGKYINHRLADARGTGQGLDAGIQMRFFSEAKTGDGEPVTWLGFGAMARDLSRTSIVWNTASRHEDRVRTAWQTGAAFSALWRPLATRLTVSLDREFGFYREWRAGAELEFFRILCLRTGFYQERFSAGAGLSLLGLQLDYAFINQDLDNTHRISGAFHF